MARTFKTPLSPSLKPERDMLRFFGKFIKDNAGCITSNNYQNLTAHGEKTTTTAWIPMCQEAVETVELWLDKTLDEILINEIFKMEEYRFRNILIFELLSNVEKERNILKAEGIYPVYWIKFRGIDLLEKRVKIEFQMWLSYEEQK